MLRLPKSRSGRFRLQSRFQPCQDRLRGCLGIPCSFGGCSGGANYRARLPGEQLAVAGSLGIASGNAGSCLSGAGAGGAWILRSAISCGILCASAATAMGGQALVYFLLPLWSSGLIRLRVEEFVVGQTAGLAQNLVPFCRSALAAVAGRRRSK